VHLKHIVLSEKNLKERRNPKKRLRERERHIERKRNKRLVDPHKNKNKQKTKERGKRKRSKLTESAYQKLKICMQHRNALADQFVLFYNPHRRSIPAAMCIFVEH
jgi:hypothetical protein